jgi:hypothetical protein
MDALLVVSGNRLGHNDRHSQQLYFYVQIQHLSGDAQDSTPDVTVLLYRSAAVPVTAERTHPNPGPLSNLGPDHQLSTTATTIPQAELLHQHLVQNSGFLRYVLVQLGGLAQRHRTLCWAPIDRVLCASLTKSGQLEDVRTIVRPAQTEKVCQVPDSASELGHVISGVAIASTPGVRSRHRPHGDSVLAVYFGCVAQIRSVGGAGLVRMLDANDFHSAEVMQLPFLAGSAFVVDRCAATHTSWQDDYYATAGDEEYSCATECNSSIFLLLLTIMHFGL